MTGNQVRCYDCGGETENASDNLCERCRWNERMRNLVYDDDDDSDDITCDLCQGAGRIGHADCSQCDGIGWW